VIIVEGPDGAGKTTLINKIREVYPDLELAPRVVSKDAESMVNLQGWVNQNLTDGFQYRLFDRHRLISEFIYGPMLRQQASPGFTDMGWVYWSLRRFYEINPVIIYCLPPLDTVKFNVGQDIENQVVWDHIEGMYTAYVHRMSLDILANRTVFRYDYTHPSHQVDPLIYLHQFINEAHERANQ
jgi:hypothetical protein